MLQPISSKDAPAAVGPFSQAIRSGPFLFVSGQLPIDPASGAIVSEDPVAVARFFNEIDSAILLHNASTQFADGGEFGMGAEIGIATGKMHARGPVGVEQLTSFKYRVRGNGQTRP